MHRNIGQKPHPLRKPLKDDLLYTYESVYGLNFILFSASCAKVRWNSINTLWRVRKKWKRKETFFFFFFPFVLYTYSKRDTLRVFFKEGFWVLWLKKKVEISIGEILVPCWFHWFFIVRLYYFINIIFCIFAIYCELKFWTYIWVL